MSPIVMCVINNFGIDNLNEIDFLFNKYPSTYLDKVDSSNVGLSSILNGVNLNDEIEDKIKDRTFFENERLNIILNDVKQNSKTLHLVGSLSRSSFNYLVSLLEMCRLKKIHDVYIHLFLKRSNFKYIDRLNLVIRKAGFGVISSVSSITDSDTMYEILVNGNGIKVDNFNKFLNGEYKEAIFDKNGTIEKYDSVILFDNDTNLNEFFDLLTLKNNKYYISELEVNTFAFDRNNSIFDKKIDVDLFSYLSNKGLKQLIVGLDIDSLKMCRVIPNRNLNSNELTDILLEELADRKYDFVFVNYEDTNNISNNLEKILDYVNETLGTLVVVSSYSENKLPFLITNTKYSLIPGKISDITATILNLLGISKPYDMDGKSLITIKKEVECKRLSKKLTIFNIISIIFIITLIVIYTCRFFYYKSREDKLNYEITDRGVL